MLFEYAQHVSEIRWWFIIHFSLWGLCYGSWRLFCACTAQSWVQNLTLFHTESRGSPFTDLYKLILKLSNPQVSFFSGFSGQKASILGAGEGGSFTVLHIHHGWHYLQSEMTKNGEKKGNSPHIHWKTRAQYFLIPLTKDKGIFSIF